MKESSPFSHDHLAPISYYTVVFCLPLPRAKYPLANVHVLRLALFVIAEAGLDKKGSMGNCLYYMEGQMLMLYYNNFHVKLIMP